MSEETVVPLRRFSGHRRSVGLMLLGNVVVGGAAALANLFAAGAPTALRATATIAAGAVALVIVVLALRRNARAAVARLVVRDGIWRFVKGRHVSPPRALCELDVRRLAYLSHEAGPLAPHVRVLELGGLTDPPLRIAAPGVLGGRSQAADELRAAPSYEVQPAHWSVLRSLLSLEE